MRDFALVHLAAGVEDFEPADVADGFGRFGDGAGYGVFDTGGRVSRFMSSRTKHLCQDGRLFRLSGLNKSLLVD